MLAKKVISAFRVYCLLYTHTSQYYISSAVLITFFRLLVGRSSYCFSIFYFKNVLMSSQYYVSFDFTFSLYFTLYILLLCYLTEIYLPTTFYYRLYSLSVKIGPPWPILCSLLSGLVFLIFIMHFLLSPLIPVIFIKHFLLCVFGFYLIKFYVFILLLTFVCPLKNCSFR